jgi:hypothetical protein
MKTFTCPGYQDHLCGQIVERLSSSHKWCHGCATDAKRLHTSAYNDSYRSKHEKAIRTQRAAYREEHKEEIRLYNVTYNAAHKVERKAIRAMLKRKTNIVCPGYEGNPCGRVVERIHSSQNDAVSARKKILKGRKPRGTQRIKKKRRFVEQLTMLHIEKKSKYAARSVTRNVRKSTKRATKPITPRTEKNIL